MSDYITIPFQVSPVYSTVIILDKVIAALFPALKTIVIANLINTATKIFLKKAGTEEIVIPFLLLMLIIVYSNIAGVFMNLIRKKFELCLNAKVKGEIIRFRGKLEYQYIEANETWELMKRVSDYASYNMTNGFYNILDAGNTIVQVFSLLAIFFAYIWWVPILILAFSIPLFAIALKSGKEQYDAHRNAEKNQLIADYLSRVLTNRDNIEERYMFSYLKNINDQWIREYENARKIKLHARAFAFLRMKISGMVILFISILISGTLIIPFIHGQISIGLFISMNSTTFGLVQMMSWTIGDIVKNLAARVEYLKELNQFVSFKVNEEDEDEKFYPNQGKDMDTRIVFEHVSFKYPGCDHYILKDFNAVFESDRHYAIVGKNGAGKTTLMKLLTGLYQDYQGTIYIGNKNLKDYKPNERRSMFSVVYQDFAKYNISFKENILLGNIQTMSDETMVDQEKLKNIIHTTQLNDCISNIPNGLDTNLGKITSESVDLSGGEWQRLAFARSLYSTGKIKILDEPTAALDPIAESNLYQLFHIIMKGYTTLLITHRLGAAKLADTILVMDDGTVAECGTHEELIALGGLYSKMYESQKGWYE